MNLRDPYQIEAVKAINEALTIHRSTLLVQPTGTGKTITFAHVIKGWQGRCLMIAHREELIAQGADKIGRVTGHAPDVEMAGSFADQNWLTGKAKCVVASKDSLHERRLARFARDEFSLIITDEAHHATADTYRRIYDYFAGAKHLGVTATPDRHDEEALGQIFESVAYVYEIQDAIRDGWLVPIHQRFVQVVGLDYSKVRTTAGDLNIADAETELDKHLKGIVDSTRTIAAGRKVLVFALTVAQARRMSDIFNEYEPDSARWVCGETPRDERRETLSAYAEGRFRFLCNVGVLTEGFDDPGIQVVAMARPTKSRALYAQMAGRATRPLPGLVDGQPSAAARVAAILGSPKPGMEIIDFAGNSGRHKLVTAADILGGNYSDDVIERAVRNSRNAGGPVDALDGLEQAAAQLHAEHEAAKEAERLKPRAVYVAREISPFDELDIEPPRRRGWDHGHRPTEGQIKILRTAGVEVGEDMSRTEASALAQSIIARRAKGLCTLPQMRLLQRYGYNAQTMLFAQARGLIDAEKNRRKARV